MNPFDDSRIDQGVAILKDGGVVAFPTDTVYGVGVDPFQPEAVRKLYQIKGRPIDNPIPILVSTVGDVQRVAQNLPPSFFQLAERFWPREPGRRFISHGPECGRGLAGAHRGHGRSGQRRQLGSGRRAWGARVRMGVRPGE